MNKFLPLLIFFLSTIGGFAQSELIGTWILQSVTIDNGKEFEVGRRSKRDKISFDRKWGYVKVDYEGEFQLYIEYTFLDGKLTIMDKKGYGIKEKRLKKKIEKGHYEKIGDLGELLFKTLDNNYSRMIRIVGQYLFITQTFDDKIISYKYKKR
jgi:hypothetical protein